MFRLKVSFSKLLSMAKSFILVFEVSVYDSGMEEIFKNIPSLRSHGSIQAASCGMTGYVLHGRSDISTGSTLRDSNCLVLGSICTRQFTWESETWAS